VRFYGLDPERLLIYPFWMVTALYRQMASVRASEMLSAIVVAMSPNLEPRERQRVISRLEGLLPKAEAAPVVKANRRVKRDPAKAREYFEQIGAVVE